MVFTSTIIQCYNLEVNLVKQKSIKESTYFFLVAIFIIALGVYAGMFLYKYIHEEEIASLEVRAKTIVSFISAGDVETLSLSEMDLWNPVYQNLKNKLIEVRSFYKDTRFIYLIAERDGRAYFVVDSEDPESEDYSPPGQEYSEASEGVMRALQGEVIIEGPEEDRWGSWISSLVPLKDSFGNTVAIVGLDINASEHTAHLYTSMAFVVVTTLILLFLIFVIFKTRKKEKEIIELKSEFISLASHELRSPLTFIRWKISTLLESEDLVPDMRRALSEIKEALLKLVTMSTSILETTATDYKVMNRKELQKVEVSQAIRNAIKSVEGSRFQKGIEIVFDESLVKNIAVLGEEDKLELVFTNLLSNAIKYSGEKSKVEISVKEEKNDTVVRIKDYGVGIPDEDARYIFSGFYRAKNIKNSGIRGSGFGLYMTKKIVEFLGGMIKCESKVGEGTTFIIKFPII
jgi:signal transduction histidine kinase